jgi:hypothetical protein
MSKLIDMEIKIEHKAFTLFHDKYSITINKQNQYSAKSSIINKPLKPKLFFYDRNKNLLLTMVKASPVSPEYDLHFENGEKSEL